MEGASGGALGDDAEGDGLVGEEFGGFATEVDEAGGADAFDIAAVGGDIEIGFEDLFFGVVAFDLEGAKDLEEFAFESAGMEAVVEAGELHGDGGGATVSLVAEGSVPSGAKGGEGIESWMMPEVLIFLHESGFEEIWGDFVERGGDAVAVIGGEGESEEDAIAIDYALGVGDAFERWRRGEDQPGDSCEDDKSREDDEGEASASPGLHGASVTVIFPPRERALMERSYMDSAKAGGMVKEPRLVGLIW